MRIWSLHPKYLDVKGLVALWRETLLAKNVLEGATKGYKNHPQLNRFKQQQNPKHAINQYLAAVYGQAIERNYNFNKEKINWQFQPIKIKVTKGQIAYEKKHLLGKLKIRDTEKYKALYKLEKVEIHPIFTVIDGEIAAWEIL